MGATTKTAYNNPVLRLRRTQSHQLRREWLVYFGGVLVLWVVFVMFSAQSTVDANFLNIYGSDSDSLLLNPFLQAPFILALWTTLLYAALSVRHYALHGPESSRKMGYLLIGQGLFTFLGAVLIICFTAVGLQYFSVGSVTHINLTVFSNTVIAFFSLLFYLLVYMGTRHLIISVRKTDDSTRYLWTAFLLTFLIGGGFLIAVFQNPLRTTSIIDKVPATYYLEDNLILITAVLPIIAGWYLGLMAIIQLNILRNRAGSSKQRRFLSLFTGALITLVALTAGLQFFSQFNSMTNSLSSTAVGTIATVTIVGFTAVAGTIALAAKQLRSTN